MLAVCTDMNVCKKTGENKKNQQFCWEKILRKKIFNYDILRVLMLSSQSRKLVPQVVFAQLIFAAMVFAEFISCEKYFCKI